MLYLITFLLLLYGTGCGVAFVYMAFAKAYGEARVLRWSCGCVAVTALLIQEGCGSVVARHGGGSNFLSAWQGLFLLLAIVWNGLVLSRSFRTSLLDGFEYLRAIGGYVYRILVPVRDAHQNNPPKAEEMDNNTKRRCVACHECIEPDTRICPKCDWTQPENS
jgi:hypothetical protein